MKVAKKSLKGRALSANRATLTLSVAVYRKIDELRGTQPRSAWVQELVEWERAREHFAEALRTQYTADVCRETLLLNEKFPVHEQ